MNRNDKLLLMGLLFIGGMGYFFHSTGPSEKSSLVIIRQGRQEKARIPLNEAAVGKDIFLNTSHGRVHLHLDQTGVSVLDSPCPDKLCVKQKKITLSGQSIACLPEEVLVTLSVEGEEGDVDAILR